MSKIVLHLLIVFLSSLLLASETPSGDYILRKIDDNIGAESKATESEMKIMGDRLTRTVEFKSWLESTTRSFTEYIAPAREKGTKMLKLEDQLWIYTPQTDRTIRISGHMLRQSVMGSDLSYEDLMDDSKYSNMYSAKIEKEETYSERQCWILHLTAKNEDVAYYSRDIWVDQERYLPLKELRYAKSGKLIKSTEVRDVRRIDDRWVPVRMLFKDELKGSKGTEFNIKHIEFNPDIPGYLFTKAALRK